MSRTLWIGQSIVAIKKMEYSWKYFIVCCYSVFFFIFFSRRTSHFSLSIFFALLILRYIIFRCMLPYCYKHIVYYLLHVPQIYRHEHVHIDNIRTEKSLQATTARKKKLKWNIVAQDQFRIQLKFKRDRKIERNKTVCTVMDTHFDEEKDSFEYGV